MLQASPMLNDAQILAVGLDRAWSLLRRSPHATGQQNPRTGQEQIMTYKLMPARGEFGKAMRAFRPGTQWKCSRIGRVLQHMKKLEQMESSVCCFLARGMTVTKHGKPVTPLFLSVADLNAAYADLKVTAKAEGRKLPEKPFVEIHDLLVLLQEHDGHDAEFADWGFVPKSTSLKAVESARASGLRKARLFSRVR